MQGGKSFHSGNSSFKAEVSIFSPARWTVLVLFLLCKAVMSQTSDYTITVAETTEVPEGLCVHVPCKFTTPEKYYNISEPFYGYWFRIVRRNYYLIWTNEWSLGYLMATNDARQNAFETHVKLKGDPAQGDCSFSIVNAGSKDAGWYYFRIERGAFRYNFLSVHIDGHIHPRIILTDLQMPKIQKPTEIIWGEPVTYICEVPSACYDSHVEIVWPVEPNSFSKERWRKEESPLVWTYRAKATFVPSLEDEGRVLTCLTRYPALNKTVQKAIQLFIAYKPELSTTFRNAECWPDHNSFICTCSFHSWPPPWIKWKIDGKKLRETRCLGSMKVTSSAKWNEVNSTLNWTRKPGQDNKHSVTCVGKNHFGNHSVTIVSPDVVIQSGSRLKFVWISEIAAGCLLGLGAVVMLV